MLQKILEYPSFYLYPDFWIDINTHTHILVSPFIWVIYSHFFVFSFFVHKKSDIPRKAHIFDYTYIIHLKVSACPVNKSSNGYCGTKTRFKRSF